MAQKPTSSKPALGKGLASLFPGIQNPPPATAQEGISGTLVSPQTAVTGAGAVSAGPAIPAQGVTPEVGNHDRHPGISLANVDQIQVNQYQPRRDFDDVALAELAQSIKANGIIQPLVVRKNAQGNYELIAGERRLRAAKLAGLKQVPIVIRRSTDREALELALVENIQRQNLNCIDEALAYFQLIQDFSLTQEEAAQRVGKDRTTVSNFLRLLRLPEAIIDDLKRGILTFGHGKALLSLEDTESRLRIRAEIVEKHLSVRDTEALVEQTKRGLNQSNEGTPATASSGPNSALASRMSSLANDLTRLWSTRVELRGSEKKGKIIIHYSSRQELERLLEAMQNQK